MISDKRATVANRFSSSGLLTPKRADVVERSRLETEEILAVDKVAVGRVLADVADDGLVEAGRRRLDHLHARDELAVFLGRDLARDEDAKVPDRLVQRVNDRLTVGDDLADVVIEVENPVQRLLRRGDVVAPGAEADDRRPDVAQIDAHALGCADLPGGKLVADEQVVGDPLHLSRVQQHRVAPPGFEFEEALRLRIDLGIDVVGLRPVGVGRVQGLEIGDEVRPVEYACAHVAGERGQPRAAVSCRRDSASGSCREPRPNRRAARRPA